MNASDLLDNLMGEGIVTGGRVDGALVRALVCVRLQNGETAPHEYVIDPSGERLRAVLDYAGWVDAAPTPDGVRAGIVKQLTWRERAWPHNPEWWAADLTV